MATINYQGYNPALGVTVRGRPCRRDGADFREIVSGRRRSTKSWKNQPRPPSYISNAHRRRVYEGKRQGTLPHCPSAGDKYAQWDIRQTAGKMMALAREVMPLTLMLATGKDDFKRLYDNIFQPAQ